MHPAAQGRIPAAEIDARTRIILEAPLLRTIIRLAVPNAAVMVTQVSLGLIELYFLAKLGVDALAGVSQVFPLVSLVGAISQGAIGGGVLSAVARRLGKTERSEADEHLLIEREDAARAEQAYHALGCLIAAQLWETLESELGAQDDAHVGAKYRRHLVRQLGWRVIEEAT